MSGPQTDTYSVATARAWAALVYAFWRQLRDSGMPPREALECTVAMIKSAGAAAKEED